MIKTKIFNAPPIDKKEALRYASCKTADEASMALLESVISEAGGVLNYRAIYCELNFTIDEDFCDFGLFSINSKSLAENLKGASRVVLFLVSIGLAYDRLIAKYSKTNPSRAFMLASLGNERVEALADELVLHLEKEYSLSSGARFSPGYGDLPLSVQKPVFELLKPESKLGVYLNEEFIMSPSKSVTAFVALR